MSRLADSPQGAPLARRPWAMEFNAFSVGIYDPLHRPRKGRELLSMPVSFPDKLEVFYGAADPAAAQVYVRWSGMRGTEASRLTLTGTVRGPFSHLARTLPATVPLADQGPGEGLLARAVLPDPCYWMPGAPYLYHVQAEARDGERGIAQADRTLGIRPLGVAGRRFRLAGKGWTLRAIHRDLVGQDDADELAAWRELGAAMIARSPADELCRQASQQGVLLVADCRSGDEVAEIRRLAQWPAVGMMMLSGQASSEYDLRTDEPRGLARNVLFVQEVTREVVPQLLPEGQRSPARWAHCLMADADGGDLLGSAGWTLPALAARRIKAPLPLADARAACDALQAELAVRTEIAGLALLPIE
jgi:hypothetical protein